ncbi:MAG: phosphate starvation-inducible protein PhoH [Parcubacteria group bacterium]|nr:phosphate starvation-inducible protein PhoH [Parcubacteria group bacterium]
MTKRQAKTSRKIKLEPLTISQGYYIQSIEDKQVSVGLGFAGTGKTYIAATLAAQFKTDNKKANIILCRPNVSDSKTIGFLPGEMEEKMAVWVVPYMDVLKRHMNGIVEKYVADGSIDVVPFEYMQGRTWDNSFIMLDEAQHTTPKEMEMFLKRIGTGSKVVITGDLNQAAKGASSGLSMLVDMHEQLDYLNKYIGVTEFDDLNDIVRSDFCKVISRAFYDMED